MESVVIQEQLSSGAHGIRHCQVADLEKLSQKLTQALERKEDASELDGLPGIRVETDFKIGQESTDSSEPAVMSYTRLMSVSW